MGVVLGLGLGLVLGGNNSTGGGAPPITNALITHDDTYIVTHDGDRLAKHE